MPEPGAESVSQRGAVPLPTRLVVDIIGLSSMLVGRAEKWARQYGIPSASALQVLAILEGAGEPLPPSVITARMLVTKGAMTGIIDSLERRDLVRRRAHPTSRRMLLVAITPEGRDRLARFMPLLHRNEQRFASVLSEAEQQAMAELLARLRSNVPEDLPPPD